MANTYEMRLNMSDGTKRTARFTVPTPTAAEVGAAPAGYGLGEQVYYSNRLSSIAELDNLKTTCDFAIVVAGGVTINNINFGQAYGRHTAYHDGGHHQELFMLGMGCVLERDCWNGVWSPWDCRNPPMDLGVEYRTTERYLGYPVYTYAMNCGSLPSNTTMLVPFPDKVKEATMIFEWSGLITYWGITLPGDYGGFSVRVLPGSGGIQITSSREYSGGETLVKLKYIKN